MSKNIFCHSSSSKWNYYIQKVTLKVETPQSVLSLHLFMVRNPLNTYDPLLDKASQAQRGNQEKLQDKKSNKSLQTELHHLVLE